MWRHENIEEALYEKIYSLQLKEIDTIGISSYVWNEYLINPMLNKLRDLGFVGKIVLGGYQISYSNQRKIKDEYPKTDIFIFGYGEQSFLESIFLEKPILPIFLDSQVDFSKIPSVYTTNTIPVYQNQKMVRWETRRGCPYKCTFCAHRDLGKNKVYKHKIEKIFSELSFFKKKDIKRINILDPIFNVGSEYLNILKEIDRINLTATVTMQTRFELIKGSKGDDFLNLCKKINSHLEFGLQTIIEHECDIIDRRNNVKITSEVLKKLNAFNVSYEVSLIYGLPMQTVGSFKKSINFLKSNYCKNIIAYPLMLLKGTELYDRKNYYNMIEKEIGNYHIPTVVSSNSFTENDWLEMRNIANELNSNCRF